MIRLLKDMMRYGETGTPYMGVVPPQVSDILQEKILMDAGYPYEALMKMSQGEYDLRATIFSTINEEQTKAQKRKH